MRQSTAFLLGLAIAVVATKACCTLGNAHAQSSKAKSGVVDFTAEQYTYKLTGTSLLTGERVIAYLNQDPIDPSRLTGIIYEGLLVYHTQALWNGKGLVYARTIISYYTLEVIE